MDIPLGNGFTNFLARFFYTSSTWHVTSRSNFLYFKRGKRIFFQVQWFESPQLYIVFRFVSFSFCDEFYVRYIADSESFTASCLVVS